jgi:uncharacterized protein involved in exopolysaccharide biosynthesis
MEPGRQLDSAPVGQEFDEREELQTDLRAWLTLVWIRRRFLVLMLMAGGAVAAAAAFLLPNIYTATALILPPARPQSLSAAMMGQMSGMAGALAPSLGLKDPSDMYIGIMQSRSVLEDVVTKFELQQVYRVSTRDAARRKLLDRISLISGKESMIRVSVEDGDPKRAAELSNAFIEGLSRQNSRLAITESAQRRLFFEREVETEKTALAVAEGALRETQIRTGVVEASGQAQVVIASIAQMRGGIALREVELERLRMGATPQNPEVVRQEAELASMRSELSRLEAGGTRQQPGDPLVPVADVPKAGLDYMRALRDVKYHEALFEILSKQYEAARIDEAKEAPLIQVVDYAAPPENKSGPPRLAITILGMILAVSAGVVYLYLKAETGHSAKARAAAVSQPLA